MMHASAFILCLLGFAALGGATERQQYDLFRRKLSLSATWALRFAGVLALLLAMGALVTRQSWGLGLVMFSGYTSLAAGAIYCGFILHARKLAGRSKRR